MRSSTPACGRGLVSWPESERVRLLTGSDDTITIWVNGTQVLAKDVYRVARKDEDATDVVLGQGANRILIKVCDGGGGWGFYFRIVEPDTGRPAQGIRFKHWD